MKRRYAFALPSALCAAGLLLLLALAYPLYPLQAQQNRYDGLKARAERLYAEGSYQLARDLYLEADALQLPPQEQRWVDFRLADTLWRSQAATETPDPTAYEQARKQLQALIDAAPREEQRDRVWAEAQESMADSWWLPRNTRNWGAAWPFYQQALEWWAGARDIGLARQRYLGIVFKVAVPPVPRGEYVTYGDFGNMLPLGILENALRIAESPADRAHLHYLIALTLRRQGGDWNQQQRIPEEFQAALAPGKKTDWYDDALYQYAEWLSSAGPLRILEDGEVRQEPDYVAALALFQRLVKEYRKGETRYFDPATQQIASITNPSVGVGVSNIFLPGSEVQYHLSWRNAGRVELALYRVDLSRDIHLEGRNTGAYEWIQRLELSGRPRVRSWSVSTRDAGLHKPGQRTVRLSEKLPLGAYVLTATVKGASARDLLLVTDAAVVLKTTKSQALAYVCSAVDSSPLPGATVNLWERYYTGQEWAWREQTQAANDQGVALFTLKTDPRNSREILAGANLKDHQAFSLGNSYGYHDPERNWRIYAFTDRPAYRPGETAQWKLVARQYDGAAYSTPADEVLEYEVRDPRGGEVAKGQAKLNAFGSAWGSLALTESMPLGEYQIQFWDRGRQRHIGTATLLRLEEYKLPEFRVSIQTPTVKGRKLAFRMGETVEVEVQADYYFGGPVSNATAEVVVTQSPFVHTWRPPREYSWYYEDIDPQPYRYWGGQGQVVKRQVIKTDAEGKAKLTFDTPRYSQQDFEYRVEARVTDASRREILGSDTVRVTRQRYFVHLWPKHKIHQPGDKVTVLVKALDANNQPVETEGSLKITRDYWWEVWIDPEGREVKGDEIRRLREKYGFFPPPPRPPRPGWRLKFRGYEHEDVLTTKVRTNAEGDGELSFPAPKEGYYRVAWFSSGEKGSLPVRADTTVWVASDKTTELGYRTGSLEVVVDRDTFRAGETAPVLLHVAVPDRYVLFAVEGQDLYDYRVVHVTGTSRLLRLPIQEKHVPNVFLSAAMVSDGQMHLDTQQVVVPPVQQFLQVAVKADREEYQPRQEGTLTVTTRDFRGKPVRAEVALGLVDESVYYIQEDLAGDPRRFYYGTKRGHAVQTQGTPQQRSYVKLVRSDGSLAPKDEKANAEFEQAAPSRRAGRPSANAPAGFGYGGFGGAGGPVAAEALGQLSVTNGNALGDEFSPLRLRGDIVARPAAAKAASAPAPAEPAGQEPAVVVRSDFRSTVFWQPDVVTGPDGRASVKVTYPDSTTSWKATARVASQANQFGIADTATRTRQPLIVRLQAPRFFVVGDTATVSAVINNNTDSPMAVKGDLKADGVEVVSIQVPEEQIPVSSYLPELLVPAKGESRVDWIVKVQQPGTARFRVTTRGMLQTDIKRVSPGARPPDSSNALVQREFADAMERAYPIYEHGIEKLVARSGKVRGGGVSVTLDLPKERKPESTSLVVQVTPSMAVTMLDALPYLIDYPYGCTEQTMSRFLPAALTAKTLRDLGLKPEVAMQRVFGGIEPASAAKAHPQGKEDLKLLDDMVRQGLARLYDFQHGDGGWGWWKEGDSDHFMTAYVLWGLALAREAGLDIREDVLQRAYQYLNQEIVEAETAPDLQAWMLHALAAYHTAAKLGEPTEFQRTAFDNLWKARDSLNAYTRALLALSAHAFGFAEQARTLVDNLANGVKVDRTPDTSVVMEGPQTSQEGVIGTAHWGEDRLWWRWSDGGIEATAFALRALLAIDPKNPLVEPVTNWLIKNRRGAQWSNTRDTAISVLALNDYLRQSGELSPSLEYDLLVNGRPVASRTLTAEDALSAPSRFTVDRALLRDGANEVRILRKGGDGPIYYAAEARFFSLEEPITPAGSEVFVRRQYFRLVGRPTLLKGYVYDRVPLKEGETLRSGERVECLITVEGKNNYEYLVFEDLKPAGLEAVALRSGEPLYARQLKAGAVERKFGEEPLPAPASGGTPSPSPEAQAADDVRKVAAEAGAAEVAEVARKKAALDAAAGARVRRLPRPVPPPIAPPPGSDSSDYTGQTRWVYQELRDRKTALFIDKLPEGVWEMRYELRAEVPGQFHALPVVGQAMYVPEIRCNGTETRLSVVDAGTPKP